MREPHWRGAPCPRESKCGLATFTAGCCTLHSPCMLHVRSLLQGADIAIYHCLSPLAAYLHVPPGTPYLQVQFHDTSKQRGLAPKFSEMYGFVAASLGPNGVAFISAAGEEIPSVLVRPVAGWFWGLRGQTNQTIVLMTVLVLCSAHTDTVCVMGAAVRLITDIAHGVLLCWCWCWC